MSDFAEVHDELRAVARDLLGDVAVGDEGTGAEVDWSQLAAAGWCGLEVPEALGGGGATFAEVAIIVQELGRVAARTPYLGSAVLGVGAMGLLEVGAARDELLRDVASGAAVVAVALPGDGPVDDPGVAPFRVERSAGGLRVHGEASFVPDAPRAARLLLPALDAEGAVVLVDVGAGATGLRIATQPVVDATRQLGVVSADGADVSDAAVWRFAGDPVKSVGRLRDRAAVAVACDSLGLSEAMLEATVAYAGVRQQFGRPIGSFQAVKHACADALVQISVARELVAAAVEHVSGDDIDGSDGGAAVAASMAKAWAGEAAVAVVGTAMQLHGGIGYTWESGIHVHLKRAALNRSLFGSPAEHRRHLAARYL